MLSRNQVFNLKCKVKKVRQTFKHPLSGNQRETTGLILIPQENDQKTFFLGAWVPQTEFDTFEALVNVGSPFNISHARVGVRCADSLYRREPYLYVMDERLEKALESRAKLLPALQSPLWIQVLPEDTDFKESGFENSDDD